MYDLIIKNGTVFDGLGTDGQVGHVGVKDGCVETISAEPLDETGCPEVIDARDRWVTPGFIDIHTHYDAELLLAPELSESVRHGVTTVITGACSLGTGYSNATDCADMFSRVEALPRKHVLAALQTHKTWTSPAGWIEQLESSALGPNVASLLGHSDLRTHVMGLGPSTERGRRPTQAEQQRMEELLGEALEQGFVGMSSMTNTWDKLDGERFRSRPLPSTFATWREYGRLHRMLRKAGRILQSAPNLNTKVNMFLFFLTSAALPFRKALKTTLISAADVKADEWLVKIISPMTRCLNWLLRGRLKWQTLPAPFEVYADGIDLVVFEEFGAGAAALHLTDEVERAKLLDSEAYRRRFRKDYERRFSPRIWNRNFYEATILGCPDESVVGKTVGQVADERGIHATTAFLDLVVAYGKELRWKTTIANHRPKELRRLVASDEVQIGFADSGAHLRNMGFYNFPLQLLRMVRDAANEGQAIMSAGRAVERLTSELGRWYELDAGTLLPGVRADIAVLDPEALDESMEEVHEVDMPGMPGIQRMVRRNDRTVTATVIGGRIAWRDGNATAALGSERLGRFLRAGTENPVAASGPRLHVERHQHTAALQGQRVGRGAQQIQPRIP